MTALPQSAILRPVTTSARFLTFALKVATDPRPALARLAEGRHGHDVVVGVGAPLAALLGRKIGGLRSFPEIFPLFPPTQHALWAGFLDDDRGASFDHARIFVAKVKDAFDIVEEIDAFVYRGGRDLSGYVDGTENPTGDAAEKAAVVVGSGAGIDGGSFVSVQRFVHDLDALERMHTRARDHVIGRELESNDEIDDAPVSAHVKRSAQEGFSPPAFMVRRSMPYGGVKEHGLYFVAYGASLDAYENVLARMAGRDDGIVDALVSFTRAVTGGYYFCPPLVDGRLDLRCLGV